ncbi:phage tail protein [Salmonella enterica subsp. enterica serovar Eastbourne]|uniref:Phage tail protein n=1 Tax=Salmonella enterica subsp. enterica serovar Eastbourne TaxID=486993 RepID=A0A702B296_SALET|nr:phage tail protein [Salmonella enterica subsp. enterica serovar Eastbourne]ECA1898099.1 phage tail protein [Salmonella enterica subsp. enterica serovar Eastbourne]HAC6674906.1 phage tail protein [Salmonella enterica subsp. enterica serovar Eastbourne]HAE5115455.1 phage tail protein [Salmonella enterica subsp. enterica serovar Eastbourne]HAE8026558.1 phage tail protein [Salmonella enterica subsp. enterica serovar Eastbourne]
MPAFPKFKTIITDYGKQRLIAAMSPGETKLTLTQMAVGDGGGNPTTPDTTNTALVNEVWRAAVNSVTVDKKHPNTIVVDLLIPANVGGFWVREAGLYDEFNKLVAICSLPASEKPLLEQGSGRAQTVRMTLIVSDTSIVNITIDSTTIMATNEYVDNSLEEHEKSRNHPDATLTDKGFVKLYSGVTSLDEAMAATPKAVKIAMDNANARLAKERNLADLTNIPLARQSLQLGDSATRNVGTTQGTVAAGDDSRITGALQKSQNGGDIPDKKQFARTIGAVTSTSITFNDASGWYKIATVVMPQATSTAVIKLYGGSGFNVGAFEQAAISELVLRAGNGSPVGITATLWKRSPNGVLECAWINTSGDNYDIYVSINQYAYWLIAQYDYTGNANVTLHSTPEYSSVQPGNSTSGQTYTLYNSLMKPTAGDVEALSVNGGRLNGALGIGTDNALGGNSIVFGDNDTGFKWHSDGVLGIYANNALIGYIDNSGLHMSVDVLSNGAIRAGNAKKLSLTSNNNSALTATFNLWGDPNRPTVIELDDDQGWHLYSQRNPDGTITFTVNGDITANTLRAGGAIYQNNGDIFGSLWGNGWLSTWIHNNVVKAFRLGPVALSGGLWRDFQLGGGQVVTGFHTDGDWEMQGGDDKVYYRPIQYLVGDTWVTAPSV